MSHLLPDAPTPEELAELEAVEPVELEEIPLALREKILGPQRGSLVTVELPDGHRLEGRIERYDRVEDVVEVDFWGWHGEFQITHSAARITLTSLGVLITSEDGEPPFKTGAGIILGE